jgi:hypothetical protein
MDRESRKILLQGQSRGGLYPLPCNTPTSVHSGQVLSTIKISASRWHARLGHPSSSIVKLVLSKNNLPVIDANSPESVYDACQQGKCHQLPYPVSTSISKAPLELIFYDVWGPACDSIERYKSYVIFIDDYSKFTWIFLLKHKFEVFQKFQNHVEKLFNKKILTVQSDWGGEYQRLNAFFSRSTSLIMCPAHMLINKMGQRIENIDTLLRLVYLSLLM